MIGPKDRGGCIGCMAALAVTVATWVAAIVGATAGVTAAAGWVLARGWH